MLDLTIKRPKTLRKQPKTAQLKQLALIDHAMGLYSGGLIIGRIFASAIWETYFREGLFLEGLVIGMLRYILPVQMLKSVADPFYISLNHITSTPARFGTETAFINYKITNNLISQ